MASCYVCLTRVSSAETTPDCHKVLPFLSHLGWMLSHPHPQAAEAYQGRAIHSECLNSRLANGSVVENQRRIGVPDNVLFPALVLWVKQWHGTTEQGKGRR